MPPAIEEYERHKQQGIVSTLIWGTPQAEALNPRLEKDHIPGTSPGFGSAAAANGAKYPYLFPLAATYWSQGAAGIQFIKDKLGGSLKGKKIAYLYYDNPAGTRAAADPQGAAAERGLRTAHLRRAAARAWR